MEHKDKVTSVINGLIEICKDGEKGYIEAADAIRNGYYRVLFREYARQRGMFASQLQAAVRTLGGQPDRKGSVSGTLHRGWLHLRSAIEGKNDDAIVLECERGEGLALRSYRDALEIDLPPEIESIIQQQYTNIQETRQRVRFMETKIEKAAGP